ncbi:hypothetical protein L0664_00045 [Octadecabacter sp. G9-8]|uniref:Uncharacterized protein n=1 Tax=Octadecabacter dasysiphoniae TaxID=2909341 RepID=A0ABS9CSN2_9RHOB|nr:hypothetical protein [Octadecabacter dasysiphoniae]MCF2869445.1 hypothetical protein [Octadecabacter dasysiphoniae]
MSVASTKLAHRKIMSAEAQMAYTKVMPKRIYEDKDRLRLAQRVKPELFLTLATNQSMSLERMKWKAREFLACMDEYMLGRNWSKKPMPQRMDGLLYVEHEHSSIGS